MVERFNVSTSESKSTKYWTRHSFWNQPAGRSLVFCFKKSTVIEFLPAGSSSVRNSHKRLRVPLDTTQRTETRQVAVWIERRCQTNITRQALRLKRVTESHSYNCCSGKEMFYIFWVCIFSLWYPACNVYASYCHLWPVRLYNIFPHYLIKGTIS